MSSQLFSWKTSRAAAFCTGCSGSNDENGKPAIREFHYSSRVMTEARARCSFSYCPTRRRMSQTSCFSQSVRRFCMEMVNEQFAADVWWFSVWMFDWAFDWAHALTSILHTWQHRRSLVLAFGGAMASAVARAYNGGLGLCPQRGPGAEPLVRGSGGRSPPEAEHNYTFHKPIFAEFWCHFGKI